MPIRKPKKYNRPKKLYDKTRIEQENALVRKYGLKNKQEIWRADYAIGKIRNIAKELITAPEEEKKAFIERQKAKGFEVENITDILGLDKEDYLKRRLQSILVVKKLATTPRQARQFIAHKNVKINGVIVSSPSHLTTVIEEGTIEVKMKPKDLTKLDKEEEDLIEDIKEAAASKDVPSEEGEEEAASEENEGEEE